jgi:hypothetical protein
MRCEKDGSVTILDNGFIGWVIGLFAGASA